MSIADHGRPEHRHGVDRRGFLKRVGWSGVGAAALAAGARSRSASAQTAASYPDWIATSAKPAKRGGTIARASSWDPPVIDPRLTQSIGLFQFAGLVCNRLVRYRFPDEASGPNDLTLTGDLAESWEANPEHRVWTFKVRQGVKWQNVPPLKGRELVAADVKYCFEGYERTYQYLHSKSTKNFFRVNDAILDELTTKLRQTPDRAEQRVITKKIVDREFDQVLRMWMPYDNGFLVFQPHLRNMAAGSLRRTDGYGSPTLARTWLDK